MAGSIGAMADDAEAAGFPIFDPRDYIAGAPDGRREVAALLRPSQ